MPYRCFNVKIEDAVALITLSRPEEHNSMLPEFWRDLPGVVREIDEAAQARVLVIASSGKHFSSGMDLSVFTDIAATADRARGRVRLQMRETILALQQCFTALERARLPVLTAIQGGCVGGALDFVTACDCRYATRDAFFVIQEINLGMTADVGTFPRLCKLMPEGMVRELAFTGRKLTAARAHALGLVNEIFPDQAAMLDAVMTIAREIAGKSPLAVTGTKAMINYARDHSTADCLDYVATWQAGMFDPETDVLESLAAKAEKRSAKFADLAPIARPFRK
jgi:enoyl-CoA hydratase